MTTSTLQAEFKSQVQATLPFVKPLLHVSLLAGSEYVWRAMLMHPSPSMKPAAHASPNGLTSSLKLSNGVFANLLVILFPLI